MKADSGLAVKMSQSINEMCHVYFLMLSNPTRLAILELLRKGSKNVTEISVALNQEQSMISHNLKALERCGFVFSERRKKERFYSLNKETMEPLFKIFDYHAKKYCSAGGKCLTERGLRQQKKREAASPLLIARKLE